MIDLAPRSSPLQDELEHLRPNWGQLDGMQVPLDFGDPSGELAAAASLGLCDASALAKLVVKGPGAETFLRGQQTRRQKERLRVLAGDGFRLRVALFEFELRRMRLAFQPFDCQVKQFVLPCRSRCGKCCVHHDAFDKTAGVVCRETFSD